MLAKFVWLDTLTQAQPRKHTQTQTRTYHPTQSLTHKHSYGPNHNAFGPNQQLQLYFSWKSRFMISSKLVHIFWDTADFVCVMCLCIAKPVRSVSTVCGFKNSQSSSKCATYITHNAVLFLTVAWLVGVCFSSRDLTLSQSATCLALSLYLSVCPYLSA